MRELVEERLVRERVRVATERAQSGRAREPVHERRCGPATGGGVEALDELALDALAREPVCDGRAAAGVLRCRARPRADCRGALREAVSRAPTASACCWPSARRCGETTP